MIDTHCHIDDPQYAEELSAFLADQQANGVEAILVPGVDKTSAKDVLVSMAMVTNAKKKFIKQYRIKLMI